MPPTPFENMMRMLADLLLSVRDLVLRFYGVTPVSFWDPSESNGRIRQRIRHTHPDGEPKAINKRKQQKIYMALYKSAEWEQSTQSTERNEAFNNTCGAQVSAGFLAHLHVPALVRMGASDDMNL